MPRFRLADDGLTILELEEYWNIEDHCDDVRGYAIAVFYPDTQPADRVAFIEAANGGLPGTLKQ